MQTPKHRVIMTAAVRVRRCLALLLLVVLVSLLRVDVVCGGHVDAGEAAAAATEYWRPTLHYTPRVNWINDPNGLVYDPVARQYHMFMQYNPNGTTWGNASWGHAVSADLIAWTELDVAIWTDYARSEGIFSGSAVIDSANSSGLCLHGPSCLIPVWTSAIPGKEAQSLSYSTDSRYHSFARYAHNPVLDVDSQSFRDPSVFWFDPTSGSSSSRSHHQSPTTTSDTATAPAGYWVMTIGRSDQSRVEFYRSSNLLSWQLMSSFGPEGAAQTWECPDMWSIHVTPHNAHDDEQAQQQQQQAHLWVLSVSAGGAPDSYFVGIFNGTHFIPERVNMTILPLDMGIDFYAALTYKNAPNQRRILIAWMNNWGYAQYTPTAPWRGGMTIPRELQLRAYQTPVNAAEGVGAVGAAGAGGEAAPTVVQYRVHLTPVAELYTYRRAKHSLLSSNRPVTVTAAMTASASAFASASDPALSVASTPSEEKEEAGRVAAPPSPFSLTVFEVAAVFDWSFVSAPAPVDFGFLLRANTAESNYTRVGFRRTSTTAAGEVELYFDRRLSGYVDWPGGGSFPTLQTVQLSVAHLQQINATSLHLQLLVDESAVEVFVQSGYAVMSEQIFPATDSRVSRFVVQQGQVDCQQIDVWEYNTPTIHSTPTPTANDASTNTTPNTAVTRE